MITKTFRHDFAVAVFGVAVFVVAEAVPAKTAVADVAGFRPRGEGAGASAVTEAMTQHSPK